VTSADAQAGYCAWLRITGAELVEVDRDGDGRLSLYVSTEEGPALVEFVHPVGGDPAVTREFLIELSRQALRMAAELTGPLTGVVGGRVDGRESVARSGVVGGVGGG
jgi:hypothetical protein